MMERERRIQEYHDDKERHLQQNYEELWWREQRLALVEKSIPLIWLIDTMGGLAKGITEASGEFLFENEAAMKAIFPYHGVLAEKESLAGKSKKKI